MKHAYFKTVRSRLAVCTQYLEVQGASPTKSKNHTKLSETPGTTPTPVTEARKARKRITFMKLKKKWKAKALSQQCRLDKNPAPRPHHGPWNSKPSPLYTIPSGQYACFTYAYTNGCPWDVWTYETTT